MGPTTQNAAGCSQLGRSEERPVLTLVQLRVEADAVFVKGARYSVTMPPLFADLSPRRPGPHCLRAIAVTPALLDLLAAARPLVLVDSEQSGTLTLIAGIETWALAHELISRGSS
jgi:hypothetical protein